MCLCTLRTYVTQLKEKQETSVCKVSNTRVCHEFLIRLKYASHVLAYKFLIRLKYSSHVLAYKFFIRLKYSSHVLAYKFLI